jgi:hypothetical protein
MNDASNVVTIINAFDIWITASFCASDIIFLKGWPD